MTKKDYIPVSVIAFIVWAETLLNYLCECFERLQAPDPVPYLEAPLNNLNQKHQATLGGNAGKVQIAEKNEALKLAKKAFRVYLQGFIMKNPNLTVGDRQAMALPAADGVSTPVGKPAGQVSAHLSHPMDGTVLAKFIHVEGTPSDPRANYGIKLQYGVFPLSEAIPTDLERLTLNTFTRRKKEEFNFTKGQAGQRAVFCMRYENAKGVAGEWGPIVSTIIT